MTGFFWEYFLFYGQARFFYSLAWRHQFYLSKILSASSPGVWDEIRPSVHDDLRPLNWFPYPYFRWWKGATSALGYWPIIRPLSSSFTLSGNSFRLLSLAPRWGYRVQMAWPTFFTFFTGRPKLTYIPYFSFNGQSLAAC